MSRNVTRQTLYLIVALFSLTALLSAQSGASGQQSVTFVQLTDVHMFDEGWKQPVATSFRQAADDRDALSWSIQEINKLVASGTKIDFVAYTGDLGLQNVDLSAGNCTAVRASVEPGLPLFNPTSAINEFADQLNQLTVRIVLFVPGNNDLIQEGVNDAGRLDCFLTGVRARLETYPDPVRVLNLGLRNTTTINGIKFAGINSASFKKLANYDRDCSVVANVAKSAQLQEACPETQLALLSGLVGPRTMTPLVLFTHVPDLKDPFRKASSWDLKDAVRATWESEACQPNVLAIFAGHFHDSTRAYYGTNTGTKGLALAPCVAQKTWLAPPLAMKNQKDSTPQARGFVLATVSASGTVKADVRWFEVAAK